MARIERDTLLRVAEDSGVIKNIYEHECVDYAACERGISTYNEWIEEHIGVLIPTYEHPTELYRMLDAKTFYTRALSAVHEDIIQLRVNRECIPFSAAVIEDLINYDTMITSLMRFLLIPGAPNPSTDLFAASIPLLQKYVCTPDAEHMIFAIQRRLNDMTLHGSNDMTLYKSNDVISYLRSIKCPGNPSYFLKRITDMCDMTWYTSTVFEKNDDKAERFYASMNSMINCFKYSIENGFEYDKAEIIKQSISAAILESVREYILAL
jgi:hypothetical protein